jgi:hypothetical protein
LSALGVTIEQRARAALVHDMEHRRAARPCRQQKVLGGVNCAFGIRRRNRAGAIFILHVDQDEAGVAQLGGCTGGAR